MNRKCHSSASTGRAVVALLALLAAAPGCGRDEPVAPPPAPENRAPTPSPKIETEINYRLVSTLPSGLQELRGIAVDESQALYLAGAGGVRVFGSEGDLLREWPTSGPAMCIALGPDDTVYVGLRTKIEVFDGRGKLLRAWGKEGKGPGELRVVTGIAVRGADVLVADAGNRCVHRFDLTGDFINDIGRRDTDAGVLGLICPSPYLDCRVDADGILHVNNPGLLRVERYRLDGSPLDHWGEPGQTPDKFCGCCNPTHVAAMPEGRIVTAEKGIARVKIYDKSGKMLAFIGPEHFSRKAEGLALALDSKGRIYTADLADGNVRIFAPEDYDGTP